jgi:lipopolysaccharide transport system permease protein
MYIKYIDLIFYRAALNLRAEGAKYYLGILWWVIEPVLYLAVFYVVFEMGLRQGGDGYVSFLLCGLVVWKWFDSCIKTCSLSIVQNVDIMYQIDMPKVLFPLIMIATGSFKFLIILLVFLGFLLVAGDVNMDGWGWLIVVMFIQLFLILAIGLFVAALVPVALDLSFVVNYTMMMLFFASGIFFDINSMSAEAQKLLSYNPFMTIIDTYRSVLLVGEKPNFDKLFPVIMFSVVLLMVDLYLFRKLNKVFPRLVN